MSSAGCKKEACGSPRIQEQAGFSDKFGRLLMCDFNRLCDFGRERSDPLLEVTCLFGCVIPQRTIVIEKLLGHLRDAFSFFLKVSSISFFQNNSVIIKNNIGSSNYSLLNFFVWKSVHVVIIGRIFCNSTYDLSRFFNTFEIYQFANGITANIDLDIINSGRKMLAVQKNRTAEFDPFFQMIDGRDCRLGFIVADLFQGDEKRRQRSGKCTTCNDQGQPCDQSQPVSACKQASHFQKRENSGNQNAGKRQESRRCNPASIFCHLSPVTQCIMPNSQPMRVGHA